MYLGDLFLTCFYAVFLLVTFLEEMMKGILSFVDGKVRIHIQNYTDMLEWSHALQDDISLFEFQRSVIKYRIGKVVL